MWHVTRDMRRVTCDMLLGVNILSKFQLPSSSGWWFMIFWRLGGKGWLTDWLSELMNDEADCRTAPASPGLLIILQEELEVGPRNGSYILLSPVITDLTCPRCIPPAGTSSTLPPTPWLPAPAKATERPLREACQTNQAVTRGQTLLMDQLI